MNTRILAVLTIGMVGFAGGCNNFNHVVTVKTETFTTVDSRSNEARHTTEQVVLQQQEGKVQRERIVTRCTVAYEPPRVPPAPELPYKELEALSPTDADGVDRLLRKHVEELRIHITKARSMHLKSYTDYVLECNKQIKSNS
jgi:hypothetical protein